MRLQPVIQRQTQRAGTLRILIPDPSLACLMPSPQLNYGMLLTAQFGRDDRHIMKQAIADCMFQSSRFQALSIFCLPATWLLPEYNPQKVRHQRIILTHKADV